MANKSRFAIAEGYIKTFFNQNVKKVFVRDQLREIFEEKKTVWNLPASLTSEKFIEQLTAKGLLKQIKIPFDGYVTDKECFAGEGASIFQIATCFINKSYLSHYSAIFLNGLTTQIPKIIYITFEQSKKAEVNRNLTQKAIDAAFAKPQRRAASGGNYGEYTFLVLNGMFTNRAGVFPLDNIPVTNIERTLIDITVRPNYAGGVFSVLETYQNALKLISINKLIAILDNMNFIYPYHQAVGFYLERAGYQGKKLAELQQRNTEFDFYLTYEMEDKAYSTDWKLYFPKGM